MIFTFSVMELLTTKEELILTSVWKLGTNAYGIAIKVKIEEATGIRWLLGSIYTPIKGLLKKGLLSPRMGDPSPVRGGRAKVYYELTGNGVKALAEIQRVNRAIWDDIPSLETT